jgi:hypothetical protein
MSYQIKGWRKSKFAGSGMKSRFMTTYGTEHSWLSGAGGNILSMHELVIFKRGNKYRVETWTQDISGKTTGYVKGKNFNTEPEAVKYAREYMKEHQEKKSEEYGKSKFEIMREERKMGYVK